MWQKWSFQSSTGIFDDINGDSFDIKSKMWLADSCFSEFFLAKWFYPTYQFLSGGKRDACLAMRNDWA